MMFIFWEDGRLPSMPIYSTYDAAKEAALSEVTPGALFHIDEVREVALSDFVSDADIVSSIRERMANDIGNDDAIDGEAADRISKVVNDVLCPALDDLGIDAAGWKTVVRHPHERAPKE